MKVPSVILVRFYMYSFYNSIIFNICMITSINNHFAARKIAYLARLPTDEHRLKVGIGWFTKTAIDSITSVQSTLSKILSSS